MKLKDALSHSYIKNKFSEIIKKRATPKFSEKEMLDRNINQLRRIVQSKTSIFPENQRKEFEQELRQAIERRKMFA